MVVDRLVPAVLLVVAMSACAESDQAKPARERPSAPEAAISSEVSEDGDSRRIVHRAVTAMADEPVIKFIFEALLDGEPVIVIDGFTMSGGWKATGKFTAPGASTPDVMDARSVGHQAWMQMRAWPPPAAGCWLAIDGQAPLGIQALTPGEPVYVSLLGYLRGKDSARSAPNTLAGEVDLSVALALLQAQLFEFIEIDQAQASAAKVAVQIGLEARRLTHVQLSGNDVLKAIEDAGGAVASTSRTALEISDYRVSYPVPTTGVTEVTAPAADLVITDPASGCN